MMPDEVVNGPLLFSDMDTYSLCSYCFIYLHSTYSLINLLIKLYRQIGQLIIVKSTQMSNIVGGEEQ